MRRDSCTGHYSLRGFPRYLTTLIPVLCFVGCLPTSPPPSQLAMAKAAVAAGNLSRARELAENIPPDDPEWSASRLLLAEVALQQQDPETALAYYQRIPRDGSPLSWEAALGMARLYHAQGKLHEAIQAYRTLLPHRPQDLALKGELAKLYAVTGQRFLADQLLSELLRLKELDFRELVLLTDFDRRDPLQAKYLKRCAEAFPDDPAVNLGLAVEDYAKGEYAAARLKLESALRRDPELSAAQGLLGELLLEEGQAAMQRWHEQLPPSVRTAPEVWLTQGLWAQQRGDLPVAARCLWEAARQAPTSHRLIHQLGLVLAQIDSQRGGPILQQAQLLYDMRQQLSRALNTKGKDEAAMHRVLLLLLELGREWEAWQWAIFAQKLYDRATWLPPILERLRAYPQTQAPRIRESAHLTARLDLSSYPSPYVAPGGLTPQQTRLSAQSPGQTPLPTAAASASIRFVEQAAAKGLVFTYHPGRVSENAGVRMQESTGGGIAVLDYDLDGLPDVFLTQGEDWPLEADFPDGSEAYRDRFFRNLGTRFEEITDGAAILPEDGFGQGCAVGDWNNDGFPDLYIANIGPNQLWLNQGDGTFRDVTAEAQLTHAAWTSSCLIVDLNADGHPDLFDVNYLEGEGLYRKICDEKSCTPLSHQSAPDHLYLSRGDGTFEWFDYRGETRWGAGLGVVAFREERPLAETLGASPAGATSPPSSRLHLFIANDHEPNFLLLNTPGSSPGNLSLTDAALLRGLALNKDGKPTACMGVAAGDVNQDGLLDFFVTNYKEEANNLYLQSAGGYFSDAIAGTGLLEPGLPYVGWGAQFLDADQNGRLDLLVANGHVGDFRLEGIDCYMPPQLFYHLDEGRFVELPPTQVGPYFSQELLGRSLATLDWNRDGLIDALLAPIAAPVALLTNQTEHAGHFVAVQLHAVNTARDAIGTLVTVTTAQGRLRRQLIAGDGYQASNERLLWFGLGHATAIERMEIEWPSGMVQTFERVPVDTFLAVVEGRGHYVLTTRTRSTP